MNKLTTACMLLFLISSTLQAQNLTLAKSGIFNDENGDGFAQSGETVSYSFTVSNQSNQTYTNISITDPLVSVMGSPISLGSNQSDNTSFAGSYSITNFDIDIGEVENIASVNGQSSAGGSSGMSAGSTVMLPQNPELLLTKVGTFVDENGDGTAQVGETISYVFTVENTGNVTFNFITIIDPIVTVLGGPIASLSAGQTNSSTFTGSYTLSSSDLSNCSVQNTAMVSGVDPNGMNFSASSTSVVSVNSMSSNCNNGIYSGNGMVPSNTIATLTDQITFDGDVAVSGQIIGPSDIGLKYRIQNISDAAIILNQLQPKSFEFKQNKGLSLPDGLQYGLIAQEVEEILPEIVNNFQATNSSIFKGINYQSLITILIAGIQDQQSEIEKLKMEMAELRDMIKNKK